MRLRPQAMMVAAHAICRLRQVVDAAGNEIDDHYIDQPLEEDFETNGEKAAAAPRKVLAAAPQPPP